MITAPYYLKTKEDIVGIFKDVKRLDLLRSAVSCSSTRTKSSMIAHCGCCSQCIDRRLAIFAAGLADWDCEYANDFLIRIRDKETTQRLYQQMRFASANSFQTENDLFLNYGSETQEAIEYWPCDNPEDSLKEIHELLMRYSDSAMRAVKQMQLKYEDLRTPIAEDSFLKIVTKREYLKTPFERRVEEIDERLNCCLPLMFKSDRPKDENDFNNKIVALLKSPGERWFREYPVLAFGITSYRADSSHDDLIIESKYIRGKTTAGAVTNGIASDITIIDEKQNVFFIVYDPERKVIEDDVFCNSLMKKKSNCFVKIYR